jgi:hypothetical protein
MSQSNFEGFWRAERIKGAVEQTKKHENMKKTLIPIIVATFGLAASPALLAQGCCGGGGAMKEGCSMAETAGAGGHEGHGGMQAAAANKQNSTPRKIFMAPVQSVYDNYITVQGALAQDSLNGVSTAATAMAKAIQGDSTKMQSPKVAQQAEALAKAKDLATARDAFKSMSDSLIQHLKGAHLNFWKGRQPREGRVDASAGCARRFLSPSVLHPRQWSRTARVA